MNQIFFTFVIIFCCLTQLINCSRPTECELPYEIGRCRAMIPSYYFNPSSQKCEPFMYGGCEGNGNRFESEEKCLERCGGSNTGRNG